jgi:hypothetical protein
MSKKRRALIVKIFAILAIIALVGSSIVGALAGLF